MLPAGNDNMVIFCFLRSHLFLSEPQGPAQVCQALRVLASLKIMHIFEEKGKEDRYKEGNYDGQYADLRPHGFELLFGNEGRVNDVEAEVPLNLRQGLLLDLSGDQFVESVLEQGVRRLR